MRISIDTTTAGAVELVAALARITVRDAEDPEVRAALFAACSRADGMIYESDDIASPFKTDEWATFLVLFKRYRRGVIKADCEDLAAAHAAYHVILAHLQGRQVRVQVCITQPHPGGVAHAYVRINGRVWDPSVFHGMTAPRDPNWYDTGDVYCIDVAPRMR